MVNRTFPHRHHRGQALTEMAALAPVLLLFLFGIIEFGRFGLAWTTVQQAARIGTRFAITGQGEDTGTRISQIMAETQTMTDNLSSPATITVRSWPGVVASGTGNMGDAGDPCDLVEVEVQYTWQPAIGWIQSLMPNNGQVLLVGRDRKVNEPWVPCT